MAKYYRVEGEASIIFEEIVKANNEAEAIVAAEAELSLLCDVMEYDIYTIEEVSEKDFV
jgi:hypothetical protein